MCRDQDTDNAIGKRHGAETAIAADRPIWLGSGAWRIAEALARLDAAPVPIVAAAADVASVQARRHLDHLVRSNLAEHVDGRYTLTAEGCSMFADAPALDVAGCERVAHWYASALFAAARRLGSAALPGGEEIDPVPDRPAPVWAGFPEVASWYAGEYESLLDVLEGEVRAGRNRSAWRLALLMLNIDAVTGPSPAWREVAELGAGAAGKTSERAGQAALAEYHGKLLLAVGEIEAARAAHEQAKDLWTALGDEAGIVRSLNALGLVELRAGRVAEAESRLARALELAEEIDAEEFATYARLNLGAVCARTGLLGEAGRLLTQSIKELRESGRQPYLADALRALAEVHRRRGEHQRAREIAHEALEVATGCGLPQFLAAVLVELGAIHEAAGESHDALACWHEAQGIYTELGDGLRAQAVREQLDTLDHREGA